MNNRKLILFDYDGVIVDSMLLNLEVVSSVLEKLGYYDFPTIEFCRDAECISFEAWARKIGVREDQLPEYIRGIHEGVVLGAPNLLLFDGMRELLRSLSEQYVLGVITASTSEAARKFFNHHGIDNCFSYVVGGEEGGSKSVKISKIVEETESQVESVFYVGDAGTDVQQGKLAGVKTIAVTWGFQGKSRLDREKPDFIVDSVSELAQIFQLKFE